MKFEKYHIYFLIGLIFLILAIIFSNFILEIIGASFLGIGLAFIKSRKLRIIGIAFALFWTIIAIIFDPIIKPQLDLIFKVNTVGNVKISMITNTTVFLAFLSSYLITKYFNRLKK